MTLESDEIKRLSLVILNSFTELVHERAEVFPQTVANYKFITSDNQPIELVEMFGDFDTLLVVHNMGKHCDGCTSWADGFNRYYDKMTKGFSFYLSSPDTPEEQKVFSQQRNWQFPIVSVKDNEFANDMSFQVDGAYHPGLSLFQKQNDEIVRINLVPIGSNPDFDTLWPLYKVLLGL